MSNETPKLNNPQSGAWYAAGYEASPEKISADISVLLRETEFGRSILEEVRSQIAVIRQVIDYILFVTPEQAKEENDLYPFSIWLADQLNRIRLAGENKKPQKTKEDEDSSALGRAIHDELGDLTALIRTRLAELKDENEAAFVRISEMHEMAIAKLSELRADIKQTKTAEPEGVLPFEDFDLQILELRKLIESKGTRAQVYDNFFYGLVVFMLIVNFAMLAWIKLSS